MEIESLPRNDILSIDEIGNDYNQEAEKYSALWIEKYSPKNFLDLVTEDVSHLI